MDHDHDHEEEVITTMTLALTADGSGDVVTLKFEDLDGEGGNAPTITGGTLKANTTYTGSIGLLNESGEETEDIGEEVKEEDEEHQFFFQVSGLNLTVDYADMDADGNPVGLATTVTTGEASTGTLTVILRHEPDKNAENVAAGDITSAGGSTDVEATFDVTIEE